ncbi:MAG: hypothetical protein LC624_10480 [Halobacteriales archaeon]|nr:hypothetical protein [Halobacteriales archaeon]
MGLSAWVEGIVLDPERRAKAFHYLWLMSLGMVGLGYALIAKHYWGALHLPSLP